MLRLARLDYAEDDPGPARTLVNWAIDDLVSERLSGGCTGFAVDQLCAATLAESPQEALACAERLIECGVGVDAIFGVYIPRVAARLGEMWADDSLAFSAVTLGMTRLTEVFRRLSPTFLKERAPRQGNALFALCPGESHALGVVMAADYFRRGGWTVRVELKAGPEELERIVRGLPFDVIGLSAACRRTIPTLTSTVARLRAAARPATLVVIGGPLAAYEPTVAAQTGADVATSCAQRSLADLAAAAPRLRVPVGRRGPMPFPT